MVHIKAFAASAVAGFQLRHIGPVGRSATVTEQIQKLIGREWLPTYYAPGYGDWQGDA
jgi:hypothetical protein